MAVIHTKTPGGIILAIAVVIVLAIIYFVTKFSALNEMSDVCAKYGVGSSACIESMKKNGVSCAENGMSITCRK